VTDMDAYHGQERLFSARAPEETTTHRVITCAAPETESPGPRPTAFAARRVRAIPPHASEPSAPPHEHGQPLDAPAQHHHFAQPARISRHAHQRAPHFARSAQHRCELRGTHPCMPYHALSSGS
jgi:hypothetical protein